MCFFSSFLILFISFPLIVIFCFILFVRHRFDVGYDGIEQWVQNVLPSRSFGHIVLTTTYGIMDQDEARRKKTGGKILGFFY